MSSSDVFRLCFVKLRTLADFEPDHVEGQVYEGRPRLKGPVATTAETMISMVFPRKVSNYSLRLEKNMGDFDELTGLYDGCLGSVQRNESDAVVIPVAFPTQDYEKINPAQIIIQEPLTILQGYKPTTRTGYADTLKAAVPAFTPGLWMLMFWTLIVFMILFKLKVSFRNSLKKVMKRKKRTKKDDSTYEVLSLFIQQDSFDYHDRTRSYLSVLITLMSFILINYFCNLMSTEQVVVPKPIIFESYMDFLTTNEMTPVFLLQLDDHKYFKSGNSDVKLWWKSMVYRTKNESKLFADFEDFSPFIDIIIEGRKLKRSFFVNNLYSKLVESTLCHAMCTLKIEEDVFVWTQIDRILNNGFPKTMIVRKVEGNAMIDQSIRRLRSSFEMGVQYLIRRQLSDITFFSQFLGTNTDFKRMHDCMSDVLVMEKPDLMPFSMHNLKSIFDTFFVFVFISCCVLCFECRLRIMQAFLSLKSQL